MKKFKKTLLALAFLVCLPVVMAFSAGVEAPGNFLVNSFSAIVGWDGTAWVGAAIDSTTHALKTVTYPHAERHSGNDYECVYSVVSLGAMLTPDDMITLTWTTPNTTQWEHLTSWVTGTGEWRVRLIEAPTGGAASQTEQWPLYNTNRNSSNVSSAIALDSTAGEVSYDATLATGGITLYDVYIPGGSKTVGSLSHDLEKVLKQNTKYQLSVSGDDLDPCTLAMGFYEHTNR